MCGIVGIVLDHEFSVKKELLPRLKRLEYRGYDSAGYATSSGVIEKAVGDLTSFVASVKDANATAAISHTRWATHGGVTKENAHPHGDCKGEIFAVHNGIIENYEEMKKELESKGCVFKTNVDTEVISHFFEREFEAGKSWNESAVKFMSIAKGTFAVLIVRKGDSRIYALKRDSPLVLGVLPHGFVLSSDMNAFNDSGGKAIFFGDDEFAEVSATECKFFDRNGNKIQKQAMEFNWTLPTEPQKTGFSHYMIKEIHEQPEAAERLIRSLQGEQAEKVAKIVEMIKTANRVVFTAAGTSYFATLLGVYYMNKCGLMAHSLIASEFENYMYVDKDSLVIAVSQSGETMDVVDSLKFAKQKGAKIVSIVNVPHSTIQRMSSLSLELMAGPEICVASTKSFVNQSLALLFLASKFGFDVDFSQIPQKIQETISANEEKSKEIAKELDGKNDAYVLGRGLYYPAAREIALKMKEISYMHVEGMMGGELKHGTIALIEPGTPVFSLINNNEPAMISNTREVAARGGRTIIIGDEQGEFYIPAKNNGVFPILAVVVGQMVAYYTALRRGLPIDKPRNLAKSVTVR